MNLLLQSDLEPLLEDRPGPCLSFYLPVFGGGAQTQQGPIRLKNLLERAGGDLQMRGYDENAIETLLGPLADLLDDVSFWNTREVGIALFQAPGFTRIFHLPRVFAERYTVGDHFFVRPLLPLVANDAPFYVLALSQNEARLLEATCRTVRRLEPEDLPRSLTDALGKKKTAQNLQYHTASAAHAGALPAVYHGHGVGKTETKAELRRYLRKVETVLRKLLAGRSAPLVLAGAEPLPSIYRELSAYPHLAPAVIAGNAEHLSDAELRDRAWKLLEPTFQAPRRRAAERFGELVGIGRASTDVLEILPAADHGRVEALFLACDTTQEEDDGLLDAAALSSLRHGGTVYGVEHNEVPGGGDLAALFRY